MTHFHSDNRLPVRAGPSPMEDAIVQQVEWYMGRLNLERDEYLKHQMDDELWVSLDVILNFPKMLAMGVTDKRRVASLLQARSTIVEVDDKAARIRPAWARRSTIVMHDVPPNARLDQIAALFHIPPSNTDLSKAAIPPQVSHPAGLISIQQAAETTWLAIFDFPTGAQDALPLLDGKQVNGQKITPEVHVENALRLQSETFRQQHGQSQQPGYPSSRNGDSTAGNSAPYAQVAGPMMSGPMMSNQMHNPMGMAMSVMHHPQHDVHVQYPYGPHPAAYVPQGYAPQSLGVPRQYMGAPRGVPAGYVMAYSPSGPPYDPSHSVPTHAHAGHVQQQQADQTGGPIISSGGVSVENSAMPASQSTQLPNGGSAASAQIDVSADAGENSVDFAQERVMTQAHTDAQRMAAQIPFTGPMQIPVIPGQPVDAHLITHGKTSVDLQFMHRGQITADPAYGRSNGRQPGLGRDRNGQRGGDGIRTPGRGSMMDGQRGTAMGRKGKKGSRGNARHGHGNDRADGRRDGKGDGSGSDSGQRDDRKALADKKPEPNLASMHFPPLPMSDTTGIRATQPKLHKRDSKEEKVPGSSGDARSRLLPNGVETDENNGSSNPDVSKSDGQSTSSSSEATDKDVSPTEDMATSSVDDIKDQSVQSSSDASAQTEGASPQSAVDQKPAASPMSYAAILRSKKPAAPNRSTAALARAKPEAPTKSADYVPPPESTAAPATTGKEKNGRRRKASNARNGGILESKDVSTSTGGHLEKSGSKGSLTTANVSGGDSKEGNPRASDNVKSKPVVESTRAHSVWVNKPPSLFQAASVVPSARPTTPQAPIEAKKVTSPVSSQGDEKDVSADSTRDIEGLNTSDSLQDAGQTSDTCAGIVSDVDVNGDTVNHITEDRIEKAVTPESQTLNDVAKSVKSGHVNEKGNGAAVKGAWAAGGPKQWPKNSGNGIMEKASNVSES